MSRGVPGEQRKAPALPLKPWQGRLGPAPAAGSHNSYLLQGLPSEKVHRGEAPGEGRGSGRRDVQQVSSPQTAVPGCTGVFWGEERRRFTAVG